MKGPTPSPGAAAGSGLSKETQHRCVLGSGRRGEELRAGAQEPVRELLTACLWVQHQAWGQLADGFGRALRKDWAVFGGHAGCVSV